MDRWDSPSLSLSPSCSSTFPPPFILSPALATPPSCPFVTVLGGAITNLVMCLLISLHTRMRNVPTNVSLPNPALLDGYCLLMPLTNYSSTRLTRGIPSHLNNMFTDTHTLTHLLFKLTRFDVSLNDTLTGLFPNSCLSFWTFEEIAGLEKLWQRVHLFVFIGD